MNTNVTPFYKHGLKQKFSHTPLLQTSAITDGHQIAVPRVSAITGVDCILWKVIIHGMVNVDFLLYNIESVMLQRLKCTHPSTTTITTTRSVYRLQVTLVLIFKMLRCVWKKLILT